MTLDSVTQMIDKLRGTDIQHLMYVDNAMLYNAQTEGIKRTLNWADPYLLHSVQPLNLLKITLM